MAQDETKPTALDLSQGIPLHQLANGKITPEDLPLSLKKVPEGCENPDPVANDLRDCEHGHS